MNSLERIIAASERRKPDRPATSLRCTPEAWEKLQKHLGVNSPNAVLDTLDIDLRWIPLSFIGPEERSAVPLGSEGTDFWGCHIRKAENDFNTYFEFDYHPLKNAESVEDVENHSWPELEWWDFSAVPEAIDAVNQKDRRANMFFAGGAFETPWYMRGFENFMLDLYQHPDIVEAICSKVQKYYLDRALRVLESAGGKIDIIGSGGDIGGERGLLLHPEVWRSQIKPYTARLISTFKGMGLKTFYHSCGSIVPVIDDLVQVGLDILDPIQITAAGMLPEELYPRFGDRLCFHGAIDEVNLLPRAAPSEVYRETKRMIDILGKKGGYIVTPSHQVQGDTPPENIVAVYEAVRDYRWE